AELDHDGIHLPVAVGEADVQQRLRQAQVCGRTDGQEFGEAFDNAKNEREQIVVQSSSAKCEKEVSQLKSSLGKVSIVVSSRAKWPLAKRAANAVEGSLLTHTMS